MYGLSEVLIEIYFWKSLQKVVDAAVHWAIVFLWCCGIIDGSPILFFCDLFQDCSNRRGLFCLSNFEALQFFRWSGRVKCLVNFLFDSSRVRLFVGCHWIFVWFELSCDSVKVMSKVMSRGSVRWMLQELLLLYEGSFF